MADKKGANGKQRRLRSRDWFDAPGDPTMAALYLERYLNFGLTLAELHSNRPIIGIAQTGSDLSPCNRHHLQLAERVRDGIRDSGGIPIEFPVHPIQETGKRPTAALNMLGLGVKYEQSPFFWSQHYDVPINYVGHAEKWDELLVDGDIAGRDCLVRYKLGGRTLAAASIYRDVASLQEEVAIERQTA